VEEDEGFVVMVVCCKMVRCFFFLFYELDEVFGEMDEDEVFVVMNSCFVKWWKVFC
jgi:hypothetical protein